MNIDKLTRMPEFGAYLDVLRALPHAKVYVVGGAVRDLFLDVQPKDVDFVVVGVTPEEMASKLPEWESHGQFKVYIHPTYKCEFALARTERKVAKSYTGFEIYTDSNLTIEDDLARRDLTINSMAIECSSLQLVDPYSGSEHILKKVLVPTTSALMEDPLRVLRVARFIARFGPEWTVHPAVFEYANVLKASDEFDTIHISRVITELEKTLDTQHPALFFQTCEQLNITSIYGSIFDSTNMSNINGHKMELVPFVVAYAKSVESVLHVFPFESVVFKKLSNVKLVNPLILDNLSEMLNELGTLRHKRTNEVLFKALSYLYGNSVMRVHDIINDVVDTHTYQYLISAELIVPVQNPTLISPIVQHYVTRVILQRVEDMLRIEGAPKL